MTILSFKDTNQENFFPNKRYFDCYRSNNMRHIPSKKVIENQK